jgi:sec-independent protein translocase protein TatA
MDAVFSLPPISTNRPSASTMGKMGVMEVVLILLVVVLLFGGKKIPQLMRGLGQGIKEFKDATNGQPNPDQRN